MRYLLDSSVWVRFLRRDATFVARVAALPGFPKSIVACGPVELELSMGRTARNTAQVDAIVGAFPVLPTPPRAFRAAGDAVARARAAGTPVRSPIDALIAVIASDYDDVTVVHVDRDFEVLAGVVAFRQEWWG